VKIRASVILLFGAVTLAGTSNAFAWGHSGGGGFVGGRFAPQTRPFVDHRFGDRRFFFAQRPFFADRRFFARRSVVAPPELFFGPPIIGPPPIVVAPVAPVEPFR
jgi:hypothetical protein